MVSEPDEFETHARSVLRQEPELVEQLLLLRKGIQKEGEEAWSHAEPPSAASLNETNRRMIDRAASLLGPKNFKRVFGFAPDQKFDIVDPRIVQTVAKSRSAQSSKNEVDREIFVLDDDPVVRDALSMVLTQRGYHVICFADGASFLAVARTRTPAAILLEVHISGTSGLDILKELHGEDYPAPIFMISGQGDIAMAVTAIKHGALDFIEKPFRGSEIAARLDEAIEAYSRRQAKSASPELTSPYFPGREPLTRREREILEQFTSGASNREAARTLGISPRTIEDHRANIMKKLGARNAADLISIVKTAIQRHS